jgi:hypothetical protein
MKALGNNSVWRLGCFSEDNSQILVLYDSALSYNEYPFAHMHAHVHLHIPSNSTPDPT